jgi:hypothetical protein
MREDHGFGFSRKVTRMDVEDNTSNLVCASSLMGQGAFSVIKVVSRKVEGAAPQFFFSFLDLLPCSQHAHRDFCEGTVV